MAGTLTKEGLLEPIEDIDKQFSLSIDESIDNMFNLIETGYGSAILAGGVAIPQGLEESQYDLPVQPAATFYKEDSERILREQRAIKQPVSHEIANSIIRGIGSFFQSGTELPGMLIAGIPQAIIEGEINKLSQNIWTESVTDPLQKTLEDNFPNYLTQVQKDSWTYIPRWFDMVANGAGYMFGALLGGYGAAAATGKALKGAVQLSAAGKGIKLAGLTDAEIMATLSDQAPALAKTIKYKNSAQAFSGTTSGSSAEASIEARQNYNTFKEEQVRKIEDLGRIPTEKELQEIEDAATAIWNTSFALNLGVLIPTEYLAFGKFFSSANLNELRNIRKVVRTAAGYEGIKPLVSPRVFNLIERPILEATQEQLQFTISRGTEAYYNDKLNIEKNRELKEISEYVTQGLSEAYGTKEGWENGIVGYLLGLIGSAAFSGREAEVERQLDLRTQRAIDYAKQTDLPKVFKTIGESFIRQKSINDIKKEAGKLNDIFTYKNEKANEFFDFVNSRISLGRFQDVSDELSKYDQMPEEEFKELISHPEGEPLAKPVNEITDQLKKEAYEIYTIHNTIEDSFPFIEEDIKDQLKYSTFKLKDLSKRQDILGRELEDIAGIDFKVLEGIKSDNIHESIFDSIRGQIKEKDIKIPREKIDEIINKLTDFARIEQYKQDFESFYNDLSKVKISEEFKKVIDKQDKKFKGRQDKTITTIEKKPLKDRTEDEKEFLKRVKEQEKNEREEVERPLNNVIKTLKESSKENLVKNYEIIKKSSIYQENKGKIDEEFKRLSNEVSKKVIPIKKEFTQEEIERTIEQDIKEGKVFGEELEPHVYKSSEDITEAQSKSLIGLKTPSGERLSSREVIDRKSGEILNIAYRDTKFIYSKETGKIVPTVEEGLGILEDVKDPLIRSWTQFQVGDSIEIYVDYEYMKKENISLEDKKQIVYAIRRPGQEKAGAIHMLTGNVNEAGIDENIEKFIPELSGEDPLRLQREQQVRLITAREYLYEQLITKGNPVEVVKVNNRTPGYLKQVKDEKDKIVLDLVTNRLGKKGILDPGISFGIVNHKLGRVTVDIEKEFELWPVNIENYDNGAVIVTIPTSVKSINDKRLVIPMQVDRNRLSDEDIDLLVYILMNKKRTLQTLHQKYPKFEELGIRTDEDLVNLLVYNGEKSRNFYINWKDNLLQVAKGKKIVDDISLDDEQAIRKRLNDLRDLGPLSYNVNLKYIGKNIPVMKLVEGKIEVTEISYIKWLSEHVSTQIYGEIIKGTDEISYFDQSTVSLNIPYENKLLKDEITKVKSELIKKVLPVKAVKLSVSNRLKIERVAKKIGNKEKLTPSENKFLNIWRPQIEEYLSVKREIQVPVEDLTKLTEEELKTLSENPKEQDVISKSQIEPSLSELKIISLEELEILEDITEEEKKLIQLQKEGKIKKECPKGHRL